MTAEFIASLQRALAARELYGGPVTGAMDGTRGGRCGPSRRPRDWIQRILSMATARDLGLIAYARPSR